MAGTDMLTGLANRMFFRECFEQALNESSHARMAVLCLDLTASKAVNDTLGHPPATLYCVRSLKGLIQSVRATETGRATWGRRIRHNTNL